MARNFEDFGIEKDGSGISYYGGYVKTKDKYGESLEFIKGGLAVEVKQHICIFDKDSYYSLLRFPERAKGRMIECEYTEEDTYQTLRKKGVDVTRDAMPMLEGCIQKQIRDMRITYKFQNVGWDDNNTVSKNGPFFKHRTVPTNKKIPITYAGNLAIEPKGSFENWKAGIDQYVIGHKPLEFAVIAGLASVVVGYMSCVYPGTTYQNLIFHLAGKSSIGKTTACKLAISTAGSPNPIQLKTPLLNTWNQTSNNLYARLTGNHGLVVCFDEIATIKCKDLSEVIYNLSSGYDKGRMNITATGSVVQETWSTVILSTGENPIWTYIKKDHGDGIINRCFEFSTPLVYVQNNGVETSQEVAWTQSAQNAMDISAFVSENYGHAGPLLAKYIQEKKDDIKGMFDECRQYYAEAREQVKQDAYTDRRAQFIGLVLLTARLAKDGLDIDVDWKELARFLLLNESGQIPEHIKAYHLIVDQAQNDPRFLRKNYSSNKSADAIIGKVEPVNYIHDNKKVVQEIRTIPNKMAEFLKENGHQNIGSILKPLKDEGYLVGDIGHNSVKRPNLFNPALQERQYVFRVFDD